MAAPPKRTPEQRAEVARFVNKLFVLSRSETDVEFASRAGLWSSNVGRYRKGTMMPDAYTLMRLMQSVDVEITARGKAVDLPEGLAPLVPRRELQEAVDDLLGWQPDVVAKLQQLDKRLEQIESVPGSQQTNSAGNES